MSCDLARSTVKEYERRALEAGLSWPLPDVDDGALEARLFASVAAAAPAAEAVPLPDWDAIDRDLRRLSKDTVRWLFATLGDVPGRWRPTWCQAASAPRESSG